MGWVTHLIERSEDGATFDFTTFNLGQVYIYIYISLISLISFSSSRSHILMFQGMEYHLSRASHDKTRFSPSLTLPGIARERLIDPAFWASSLGLWARAEG